jgi:acetate kinase
LSGAVDRIGLPDPQLRVRIEGEPEQKQAFVGADVPEAAQHLIDWLEAHGSAATLAGVGHRVVHGGPVYGESQRVTPAMVEELKRLSPLDPAHLPGEIALIEAFSRRHPQLPQVACFDTAFHYDLPTESRLLPIPRRYAAQGMRRYGFHGLSYTWLMAELANVAGSEAARGRIVLAHLGSGASLAAVRNGKCIDTTMSFTPTAGLVMGTRTGDLDPGVMTYLMRSEGLSIDQLDDLVNKQSGLLGLSETSSDMRDLSARAADDPRAAEAVLVFCYQARKYIGALTAALGGLDTLVFAGGIGEHSSEVRGRICQGLEFLGVHLEASRNASDAPVISTVDSRVTVRVIPTNEELVIVRETQRVLGKDKG